MRIETIMGTVEMAMASLWRKQKTGKEVRFDCFGTAVHAVAFLFDGSSASCRIKELGTAINDRFNDEIGGIKLI
jgi:hypothetical protein